MPLPAHPSRRAFLAAAGAAALAAPHARARGANDALQVGCVGTGGRCRALMKSLAEVPDVRITAVCDVYDKNLDEGKKLADPKAFATKRYEELLGRKDVDAVLVGSPDHWHVRMTGDAVAAGKDVYVEKPLTHSRAEGEVVLSAQRKS